MCMTESLCCTPESNTTLSTILQFKKKIKKKDCEAKRIGFVTRKALHFGWF